jgi:hypothetical protein
VDALLPPSAADVTAAQPAVTDVPPPPRAPLLPTAGWRVAAALVLLVGIGAGAAAGLVVRPLLATDAATRALVVRSAPAGAVVTFDGDKIGSTPLVVDRLIADGAHTLKLAVPSGPSAQKKITVKHKDDIVVVSENLLATGSVVIATRPTGARVFLDGAEVGTSPVTFAQLGTDKEHNVDVRLEGYAAESARVPVDRGEAFTLTIPLRATGNEGQLAVLTSPPSDVWLDGQPWGPSGDRALPCPVGTHEVTMRAPGLGAPRVATVVVGGNSAARYYFDLRD